MEKIENNGRDLLYISDISDLGDIGNYLKDSSFDGIGHIFHVMGINIRTNKLEQGYQAIGTSDKSQISNSAVAVLKDSKYDMLSQYDVIRGEEVKSEYLGIMFEYIRMKRDGLPESKINSILIEQYSNKSSKRK